MGFFGSKTKAEKNVAGAEIQEKVEREVIVHNMPSQERIIGSSLGLKNEINSVPSSNLNSQTNIKRDFKVMGILIIFVGLIFIALIVFLTYRFVIAPTLDQKGDLPQVETEANIVPESNSNEDLEISATTTGEASIDINQTASDLDLKETADSGEENQNLPDVMQEEFQGQDILNLSPLVDSDSDGLYDEEEILLGTSIFLSDSDGDTYSDLSEIKNNYNPSGEKSLASSTFISIYQNSNYRFNFLYPSAWELKEISNNLIVFEDNDSSLVQLAIMDNADRLSILNWYEATFPEEALVYDKLIAKTGYEGVISKSGLNVYLTDEARTAIFVFSYIPASSERLNFSNIFELIYSSISFFQ